MKYPTCEKQEKYIIHKYLLHFIEFLDDVRFFNIIKPLKLFMNIERSVRSDTFQFELTLDSIFNVTWDETPKKQIFTPQYYESI